MRVIAAMSGGVDSSVAAARLVDEGHEVVGVHLALSKSSAVDGARSRGCCTIDDARDARRIADLLGIPFYVWDLSERFRADVIETGEPAAGSRLEGGSWLAQQREGLVVLVVVDERGGVQAHPVLPPLGLETEFVGVQFLGAVLQVLDGHGAERIERGIVRALDAARP